MHPYPPIDVTAKGAVILGSSVSCDGFRSGLPYRVQTHVHTDHMDGFTTSKGEQDIILTAPTADLLISGHADVAHRSNVHVAPVDAPVALKNDAGVLRLLPSGHMLGAVQVELTLPTGERIGYSGDFSWPLEKVIKVNALVVDSTHGSPDYWPRYTEREAEERLVELVHRKLKQGPVTVKGHRGTVERVLAMIGDDLDYPIIANSRCAESVVVHRRYGQSIAHVHSLASREAVDILRQSRYLRLAYAREDISPEEGTIITLSAFGIDPNNPVVEHSDSAYQVAITYHADFEGTLEYVEATGAKYVVTDSTRGAAHAATLATAITQRLDINCRASTSEPSLYWGQ